MFHCRLRWMSIGISAMMLATCSARAQLTNCMDQGSSELFKIFLDEVRVVSGSGQNPPVQARLESIRTFLRENLKASSGVNASVRDCGHRYPTNPSDFNATEFDELDNMRVVLEVWGALDGPTKDSGSLGFALVPARSLAPPAVYIVPSPNLLSSLRKGKQISAFAPLVFGISQFQNRKYDSAVPLLCAGLRQLDLVTSGQRQIDAAGFVASQKELLKQVQKMADRAIQESRKTPGSPYIAMTPGSDGSFSCPR